LQKEVYIMAMKLNTKLLDEVRELVNEKIAFVPMAGGDPAAMGGGAPMDPAAAGGMPPPGGDPAAMGGMPPGVDPAAMGGAPMDPAAMGGAPMDPAAAGGMPPPPPPAAPAEPSSGLINMTVDEFMKFIKQIVALCTSGKFGNDPKPTDGGPVSDAQAAMNAKIDAILQAIQG